MKKFSFKKSIALIAIIAMLFSFIVPLNNVKAATLEYNSNAVGNPYAVLDLYAEHTSGIVTDEELKNYLENYGFDVSSLGNEYKIVAGDSYATDGKITMDDAKMIDYILTVIMGEDNYLESDFNSVIELVNNTLSLNTKKITLDVSFIGDSFKYTGTYDCTTKTADTVLKKAGCTDGTKLENWEKFAKIYEDDADKYDEYKATIEGGNSEYCAEFFEILANKDSTKISITFTMDDGSEWYLVWGYDGSNYNGYNAYLISTKEATVFDTELSYTAKVDDKEVGGETKEGVFYPSYDETNVKKDADVTATITSKTGSNITKINGVEVKEDGTANSKGWYYADPNDKTSVSKDYKFDDYDNSTDNGMVTENVEITDEDGQTDKQTVSITWPFRIIDHTYTESGEDVVETIETNLPMDPDKIPDGWSIVEGTDNHKITRTIKKGTNVDEVTTVYQNGTGATDSVDSNKTWPNQATTSLPQTGEGILFIAVVGIAVVAVIIRKRMSNLKK